MEMVKITVPKNARGFFFEHDAVDRLHARVSPEQWEAYARFLVKEHILFAPATGRLFRRIRLGIVQTTNLEVII